MMWSQKHSQNAVAAKARRRMTPAEPQPEPAAAPRLPHPRGRAKWRLHLRDLEHGDSLTLTLHRLPWPARYVDTAGQPHSAASVGRAIATLLRAAA